MRTTVTVILLVFVVASVVYTAIGERGSTNDSAGESRVAQASASETVHDSADEGAEAHKVAEQIEGGVASANAPRNDVAAPQDPAVGPRSVIAYYFHRTQRCKTCLTMEAYARDALQAGLQGAVESGELEWRAVNVEEPEHEHFVKEYDLYASALVMLELEGDEVKRSKNLEQIWSLVGDESKFKTYVRDEALAYIEDAP